MRALVVAHDHVSPPGPIGERFVQRGYTLDLHVVVAEEHHDSPGVAPVFPDFTAYDAVVVLGAPWSVYDTIRIGRWVPAELDPLRRADTAGVPVLGICFGGQLLATAHGGAVALSPTPEIGWTEISTDKPDIVPDGPWFEWHYDRWRLPPDAVEIARNSAASQAFLLRRNLAVQFHPELTGAVLTGWLDFGGAAQAVEAGLDPRELLARTAAIGPDSRRRAHALVDGFLAHVAS